MLKILTVCGVGMGTSLLLKMHTEDVLAELGVKADVVASDLSQAKGARADLILTSPPLEEGCKGGIAEVRVIKSFVDKDEIRSVLENFLTDFATDRE